MHWTFLLGKEQNKGIFQFKKIAPKIGLFCPKLASKQ